MFVNKITKKIKKLNYLQIIFFAIIIFSVGFSAIFAATYYNVAFNSSVYSPELGQIVTNNCLNASYSLFVPVNSATERSYFQSYKPACATLSNPIVNYSGSTSGSHNLASGPLYLTTPGGSWTITVPVTIPVIIKGAAGGGGGGGTLNSRNAAGGGGGGAVHNGVSTTLSTSYTYSAVVGAGGTAGTGAPTAGGTGGTSYFYNNSTGYVMGPLYGGSGGLVGSSVPDTNGAGGAGGTGGNITGGAGGAGGLRYYVGGNGGHNGGTGGGGGGGGFQDLADRSGLTGGTGGGGAAGGAPAYDGGNSSGFGGLGAGDPPSNPQGGGGGGGGGGYLGYGGGGGGNGAGPYWGDNGGAGGGGVVVIEIAP